MANKTCKIKWKTNTSLYSRHCGATGNGLDKDSNGQRKLVEFGGWLFPAADGLSHEWSNWRGPSLCFAILFFSSFQQHFQPVSLLQFFKEPPISPCPFCHPLKPAIYDSRSADVGMSKITPSKNAPASSTLRNCFPFNCLLKEGNKHQSQGQSQISVVGMWPA